MVITCNKELTYFTDFDVSIPCDVLCQWLVSNGAPKSVVTVVRGELIYSCWYELITTVCDNIRTRNYWKTVPDSGTTEQGGHVNTTELSTDIWSLW